MDVIALKQNYDPSLPFPKTLKDTVVVEQFTPMYPFTPSLKFLKDLYFLIENTFTTSQIIIKLIMYIGNLLCNSDYI